MEQWHQAKEEETKRLNNKGLIIQHDSKIWEKKLENSLEKKTKARQKRSLMHINIQKQLRDISKA